MQRDAQREVAAERIAGDAQRQVGEAFRHRPHRADHLGDAAGVEQVLVQVMGIAVIAEMQPEHVEAFGQHPGAGMQQVARLGTAFPAVQQHDQAERLRTLLLRGVEALKPHVFAAVQDVLDLARHETAGSPTCRHAAQAAGGEHRLHMRIAQQGGWAEAGCVGAHRITTSINAPAL